MKNRTILFTASGLVVALVALRWSLDDAAPAASSGPAIRPAATHALPSRDLAVDRVRGELAELRTDVARIDSRQAARDELSFEEDKALADQRDAAKAAVLARAFAADLRDPSWSPEAEHALRDAFATAELSGARLAEAACGASLCRYVVAFDSIARRDDSIGKVIGLVQWRARGFGDASPDDPLRYVVYASRDPESFPSVE